MLRPRSLAVLVALALLPLGCAAKKRPSAVATATASSGTPSAATPEREQPVDAGPDVQAVDREALGGQALPDSLAGTGLAGDSSPLEDIRFEFDSAQLTDDARRLLEKHAQWLQKNAGVRFTVEGHCDERGTAEYNLALGDQRARAARDYLVSLGIAPERLTSVSYGKEQPLDPAGTESAWARNRRAHFAPVR
jgi:peptidoglycan-associated lipoprotein